MPLPRTPEAATAPLSTHASDTFPAPASLVAEVRSGRRLANVAYPRFTTMMSMECWPDWREQFIAERQLVSYLVASPKVHTPVTSDAPMMCVGRSQYAKQR